MKVRKEKTRRFHANPTLPFIASLITLSEFDLCYFLFINLKVINFFKKKLFRLHKPISATLVCLLTQMNQKETKTSS